MQGGFSCQPTDPALVVFRPPAQHRHPGSTLLRYAITRDWPDTRTRSRTESESVSLHGPFELLVSPVLAQHVNRPDGSGNPANDGSLENKTGSAGKGAGNREELESRNENREEQAH